MMNQTDKFEINVLKKTSIINRLFKSTLFFKKIRFPKINLSIQLILIFAATLFLNQYLPLNFKAFVFSISLSLKEILLFLLPLIIFSCLFNSLIHNRQGAVRFVTILLGIICVSNFLSIIAAYFAGTLGLSLTSLKASKVSANAAMNSEMMVDVLNPLWNLNVKAFVSNEFALCFALVLGLLFSFFPNQKVKVLGEKANQLVTLFLNKFFVPLLPLFAFGFIVKMEHEGILQQVVNTYAPIILLLIVANLLYIAFMFAIAANFNIKTWFRFIKNVLPPGILGFSTMSSVATMPVTLTAAEKNTNNPELSRAIIPATVNIHMIGDSLSIPILAMAVLLTFGHDLPNFMQYLIFTQFFMLAKFAVPGIPCGTIFVMLPLLERYFGFTPDMSAFIASIYILFDSIITCTNVLGNSALVVILSNILKKKA